MSEAQFYLLVGAGCAFAAIVVLGAITACLATMSAKMMMPTPYIPPPPPPPPAPEPPARPTIH